MGAMKTYLQEATDLVQKHQNWSMESLVGVFCKNMKCDQGTGVYFIEKAIEDQIVIEAVYCEEDETANYTLGDDCDGI